MVFLEGERGGGERLVVVEVGVVLDSDSARVVEGSKGREVCSGDDLPNRHVLRKWVRICLKTESEIEREIEREGKRKRKRENRA